MHSNDGSGQRAQLGQGGHVSLGGAVAGIIDVVVIDLLEEDVAGEKAGHVGHVGQTGGTICDFNTYKSSCPRGIWFAGIPDGREREEFE